MTDASAIQVLSLMPGECIVDTQAGGLAVEPFTVVTVRHPPRQPITEVPLKLFALIHLYGGQPGERFTLGIVIESPDMPATDLGPAAHVWPSGALVTLRSMIAADIPFDNGGLHELVVKVNGTETARTGFIILAGL